MEEEEVSLEQEYNFDQEYKKCITEMDIYIKDMNVLLIRVNTFLKNINKRNK
jgi:hypothetical protein